MSRFCTILLFALAATTASASWYWPFKSGEYADEKEPPRISELMRPANDLIEKAAELAGSGKLGESADVYRKALAELDRVERENSERVNSPEFTTLKNKRRYVSSAIDELVFMQTKENEKPVAVSDTTSLEKRLAEERTMATMAKKPARPRTPREEAMAAAERGDFAAAEAIVKKMLVEKPNGAMALNLKAMIEAKQGKFREAESTLDQAIASNRHNSAAYFNMAVLMLKVHPDDKSIARRYYETGRAMGGKKDLTLEEKLK